MSIDDYVLMCERVMRQAAQDNPDARCLQNVLIHEVADAKSPAISQPGSQAPLTILLVENELALVETIGEALQRPGYAVLTAASGEDALRITRQHRGRIDVLLSDVLMHPIDGFQIADAVKSAFPDVIVLLMSGGLIESFALHHQPHYFFQKPFSYQEMLATIARFTRFQPTAGDRR